ncbi:MAG TPA: aminotransferase class I/II-fold pyridoxal phosphate-dependent enzyme [Solirubrobacterales bacterium]|nr:aminotransferase class I/II-fold pyridoxal phosphate-dependent enzyme [Solirubrobacterales bacterium]
MIDASSQRLAVEAHQQSPNGMLDLRTSGDEIDFLRPTLDVVWASWLEEIGGPKATLEMASDYGFGDPYGEKRGAATLADHHGAKLEAGSITFSAGISAFLRQLAEAGAGGSALVERLGHPDLAYWARAVGSRIHTYEDHVSLPALIHELHPSIVGIDRPNVLGDLLPLEFFREVSAAAVETGALVLVDEAYANYLGPEVSLVQHVRELQRVVVLRSLSKAYRMGGLRVAYAVAAPDAKDEVRRCIAPLGTSTLPLLFGLRLLSEGDIFLELRRRTTITKAAATKLLAGIGLSVVPVNPCLPWVILEDAGNKASDSLEAREIVSRKVPLGAGGNSGLAKLVAPLSAARWQAFVDCFAR